MDNTRAIRKFTAALKTDKRPLDPCRIPVHRGFAKRIEDSSFYPGCGKPRGVPSKGPGASSKGRSGGSKFTKKSRRLSILHSEANEIVLQLKGAKSF